MSTFASLEDAFRPGQKKIIEAALQNKDLLTIMPTGGGKTPCGVCDSCRIRDRALIEAGREDLTSKAMQQ